MNPLKIVKVFSALTVLVWIFGAVIAGMYNNFHDSRACIVGDGWIKGSFSCPNASPLGFGTNMLRGAFWPVILVRSVVEKNESIVPDHVTQDEFEESSVGVAYTCMAIAIGARNTEDADLLVALIRSMNEYESARKQHDDFMKLAARSYANLETAGLANQFYETGCRQALTNLKQLTSRPSR